MPFKPHFLFLSRVFALLGETCNRCMSAEYFQRRKNNTTVDMLTRYQCVLLHVWNTGVLLSREIVHDSFVGIALEVGVFLP